MKSNLNALKKLIREFSVAETQPQGARSKDSILDDIIFFGNNRISINAVNQRTGNLQAVATRYTAYVIEKDEFPPETTLFRVRQLGTVLERPVACDFWEPPANYASRGRLNARKESLLYLTTEVRTAFAETDTNADHDHFLLIVYTLQRALSVSRIALASVSSSTVDREKFAFLNTLFSRPGTFAHDISRKIARRYADWTTDGWSYASTKIIGGNNLCLWPATREALSMQVALEISNGNIIALHNIDTNLVVSSVKDPETIQDTVSKLDKLHRRPAGVGTWAPGMQPLLKVLPALSPR